MNKSVKKRTGHYAHPHRKYIGNNLKITNPRLIVNNKKQKKSVTDVIVEINKTHLNLEHIHKQTKLLP